jgi:anti-sigma factor RsiW
METPEPAGIDPDFELLENYLDGELSPAEVLRVERRLAAEPELAAALGRMGAEYEVRQATYRSLEPDARAADALAAAVGRQVRRADRTASHGRVFRFGRLAGTLAACVAISFSAGWVGRGFAASSKPAQILAPPKGEPYVYQVALTDDHGNITAVQRFDKLEDAQAFAADVGRWQAQQQVKQAGPAVMSAGL